MSVEFRSRFYSHRFPKTIFKIKFKKYNFYFTQNCLFCYFSFEKKFCSQKKTLLFRKCPHLCKRKLKWDFTMFVESKNQRFSVVIIKSRKLIKSLQAIRFVSKQFFNKSDISACENHMMFKLMRIFFTYFAKIKLIIIFSFRFPSVFHFPHNHCGIMCLLAFTRTLIVCFSFTRYSHAFHIFVCSMFLHVRYLPAFHIFFSHTFHIYATSMRFICYTHTYLLCLHGFHISTAFMKITYTFSVQILTYTLYAFHTHAFLLYPRSYKLFNLSHPCTLV